MATVYYDFSATTNGSGTLASPKNTWTAPSNGDVIRLKRGTTFRSGQLNLSQSSLTFEAWYNADGSDDMLQPKPIITVQLTAGSGGINMTGTGTHVWRNIVFKDFLNTNTPTGNTPNALVLGSTGTYGVDPGVSARILDCEFYNISGDAIAFNGVTVVTDFALAAPVAQVLRCVFNNIGGDAVFGQGQYFEVGYCTMTRLSMRNSTGDGVGFLFGNPTLAWIHHNYIDHQDVDVKQCIIIDGSNDLGLAIIEDNILIGYGNDKNPSNNHTMINVDQCRAIIRRNQLTCYGIGISVNTDGPQIYSNLLKVQNYRTDGSATVGLVVSNAQLYNNTFIVNNNTGYVVKTGSGRSGNVIKNNIVVGAGTFYQQGNGSTGTYDYNVFYNTTNPYLDNSSAAISNGANDLVTNPLFISGSYKLNSSSPAKSTGTFVAYNRDLDNIPFSNPPSRGAFTYFART